MARVRFNMKTFAGLGGLIVLMWISFLLGTMTSAFIEKAEDTGTGIRRRDSVDQVPPCVPTESVEETEKDQERDDDSSEDFVHIDKKLSGGESNKEPIAVNHQQSPNQPPPSKQPFHLPAMHAPSAIRVHNTSSIMSHPYQLTWTHLDKTQTNIFSAYYDERQAMHGPSIVLPGYQSKKFRNQTVFCLFTYDDGTKVCSKRHSVVREMDACNQQKEFDKKKERQYIHLFHICTLEYSSVLPSHVALSNDIDCNKPSANIPVYSYRPKGKLEYGVCIQTPAFGKTAQDFVNFIELYQMLGAEFFTLYVLNIDHSTLSYLHKTYAGDQGILEIVQWTNHLHEKEPIHYYGEILAIHDCLYRNMHRVKYLAFVDLDEALIPRRYNDWNSMLHEIDQSYIDSFIFANSIFMKTDDDNVDRNAMESWKASLCKNINIPFYFTNFNRVKCVFNFFSRSKLIVKPELIIDTDIHGVCTRASNTTHYLVPEDSAVSQHYRSVPTIECRKNRKTRKYPSRLDNWMIRYSKPLLSAINNKLCSNKIL